MKNQIPIYVLIAGVGLLIGLLVKPTTTTSNANSDNSNIAPSAAIPEKEIAKTTEPLDSSALTNDVMQLKQQLTALQNELSAEIDQRQALEIKLASLQEAIDSSTPQASVTESENSRVIRTQARQSSLNTGNNNWFDEQALIVAGINPDQANQLKNFFEETEMEKLYLRDQATREGWMGTERFQTAMQEINNRTESVRSELDDTQYDAYLYASGKSNRVIVSSVLNSSPANQAGIQPGDAILKYDNQRVYSWNDLTSATREGTPDAMVSVTIQRNGQQQQLFIPRGPLGVRLTTDSISP